jgi:glycerol-3-phosphate acyltransferase PlsX
MGGDHGPEVIVPGAALSLSRHPDLSVILFGDEQRIKAALAKERSITGQRLRIVHTATAVGMDDKPSQAVRRSKGSSMWLAIEAVRKGEAHGAISAGNTGALMALSKLILRPLPDV